MPVAFLIENCLTSGLPVDTIIDSLKKQDFSIFKEAVQEKEMDFEERYKIAEQLGEDWGTALKVGYEFKWLHMNGLKKLLRFRFHKVQELDYLQNDLVISSIRLDYTEFELLSSLINSQWIVLPDVTSKKQEEIYRIELKFNKLL